MAMAHQGTAVKRQTLPKAFNQIIRLKAVDLLLSEILKPIAESTRHNIILGPGVQDRKMSIDVRDVSIEHALNILLYGAGYGFRVKDHDLIILARETRIFRIVLPPVGQQFNDVTSNESFVQSTAPGTGGSNSNNQQTVIGVCIYQLLITSHLSLVFPFCLQSNKILRNIFLSRQNASLNTRSIMN